MVGPEFWAHLRSMVEAVPDQIIGLESVHPATEQLRAMGYDWCTTSDGLIGVGYVIPAGVLDTFLRWRSERMRPGAVQSINEDTLIGLFCMSTGRQVWHPIPTIIDHDVDIISTYGNDSHAHRRPLLTTVRGASTNGWRNTESVHLGRFYSSTPRSCRRWVIGFHKGDMDRATADRGVT